MTQWPLEQFNENGFAVIENFLTLDEVNELHEAGIQLCDNAPKEDRVTFSAFQTEQYKRNYFIESADKVHYFYETGALDENGELLIDPKLALNKVGHALHSLHPTFRKYTFDARIHEIAKRLGFRKPAIPQSMYIYKNPGVGGEVKPHQDASYLHTEPNSIVGFWIPLDDATVENGCLWFIRGSQKDGLTRRLIRSPNKDDPNNITYDRPLTTYPDDAYTACPVKKGSLVLIHGFVVHRSEPNKSTHSRHAYTFHILESDNVKYSEDNWLQYPKGVQFPSLIDFTA